jgi:hypothetical protein
MELLIIFILVTLFFIISGIIVGNHPYYKELRNMIRDNVEAKKYVENERRKTWNG